MSIPSVTEESNEQHTAQVKNALSGERAKLEGELLACEEAAKNLGTQEVCVSGREAKAMGEIVDTPNEGQGKQPNAESTLGSGIIEKAAVEATGCGGIIEGVSMVASALGDKSHHATGMGLDSKSFSKARCINTGFGVDVMGSAKIAGSFMNPEDISTKVKGATAKSAEIDGVKNTKAVLAGRHAEVKHGLGHAQAHGHKLGNDSYNARMDAGAPVLGGVMGGGMANINRPPKIATSLNGPSHEYALKPPKNSIFDEADAGGTGSA